MLSQTIIRDIGLAKLRNQHATLKSMFTYHVTRALDKSKRESHLK